MRTKQECSYPIIRASAENSVSSKAHDYNSIRGSDLAQAPHKINMIRSPSYMHKLDQLINLSWSTHSG